MDVSRIAPIASPQSASQREVHPDVAARNRVVSSAVRTANEYHLFGQDRELVFALDPDTSQPIVRLIDAESRTVIRQIPPKYVVELAKEMRRQIEEKQRHSGR